MNLVKKQNMKTAGARRKRIRKLQIVRQYRPKPLSYEPHPSRLRRCRDSRHFQKAGRFRRDLPSDRPLPCTRTMLCHARTCVLAAMNLFSRHQYTCFVASEIYCTCFPSMENSLLIFHLHVYTVCTYVPSVCMFLYLYTPSCVCPLMCIPVCVCPLRLVCVPSNDCPFTCMFPPCVCPSVRMSPPCICSPM